MDSHCHFNNFSPALRLSLSRPDHQSNFTIRAHKVAVLLLFSFQLRETKLIQSNCNSPSPGCIQPGWFPFGFSAFRRFLLFLLLKLLFFTLRFAQSHCILSIIASYIRCCDSLFINFLDAHCVFQHHSAVPSTVVFSTLSRISRGMFPPLFFFSIASVRYTQSNVVAQGAQLLTWFERPRTANEAEEGPATETSNRFFPCHQQLGRPTFQLLFSPTD